MREDVESKLRRNRDDEVDREGQYGNPAVELRAESYEPVAEVAGACVVQRQREEHRDRHRPDEHAPRAERAEVEDRLVGESQAEREGERDTRVEGEPEPAVKARTGKQRDAHSDRGDKSGETDYRVGKAQNLALP